MSETKRLAVLVASLANGGIGKMRLNLINEFVRQGVAVDLLVADRESPYMGRLDPSVRLFKLNTSHAVNSIPALYRYLRRERPDAMLTQRIRVNVAALRARRLARSRVPIYVTLNTNLSAQLESMPPRKRSRQLAKLRRFYPLNDGLIAVSRGVAEDAAALIGIDVDRIRPIANPVVTPALFRGAEASANHPWLDGKSKPVLLAVGRLEPQKDFGTLLEAFARLRDEHEARLIILGEGKLRESLQARAVELGIADDLAMPGFVDNPAAFMARADLFVLSSRWEGSPNSLTEAVALGTPVVATDCPNGPSEILENGRYGELVAMGDSAGLAAAMARALVSPPDAAFLRQAGERYTVERSARGYLRAMNLSPVAEQPAA
ncbi:glycosyltransferase [Ectothiorhodospiraceae bacterium WFHF3C12]|nr:glycosyltransferase [Ectothiorhodospiraceae bacterium WFHF3C12]